MSKLETIDPTVLFVREKGELWQMVNATVENGSEASEGNAEIDFKAQGTGSVRVFTGSLERGKGIYPVYVPNLR